ncbi:MAG: hypothetical protein M1816_007375 [Peltula sp. TS41687]|nr:MAG: hypothetical protein M1816_007375 [Peltula sp. TS41687]
MKSTLSIGLLLVPLASAHFHFDYPTSRGSDTTNQRTFPCGGYGVSSNRTEWPVAGGPIHLTLGHDRSKVQVLLALGTDPGEHFNITLLPTIQEEGPGKFCLPTVHVPAGSGVMDGMDATIQVITDTESGAGLYNCADITFRTSAPQPSACTNGTGVSVVPLAGAASSNANGTMPHNSSSASGSATGSGSPSASSPAVATGAARRMGMEWGMGAVLAGALGFALLL